MERDIQIECVQWFKEEYKDCIIFSVPNEATRTRSNYFKPMGVLAGCSDLVLVFTDGDILFIEMKQPRSYQSMEQKEFQKNIERCKHKYHVVKSLDEFKYVVKHRLDSKPVEAETAVKRLPRSIEKAVKKIEKQNIQC